MPRLIKYVVLGIVSFLLLAVGAIQVQQRILRHRAEELLSDIRSLELRKTTFAEAQVVFQRWKRWGRFEGECSEGHCFMEITLEDFWFGDRRVFYAHPWLTRAVMRFGGRPGSVNASVTVEYGIVWGKAFGVILEVPPNMTKGEPGDDGDWIPEGEYPLYGNARSVSRFDSWTMGKSRIHPDYDIWRPGGCNVCVAVEVHFTPFAASEDVNRLMQFNLSCLTRWNPCTTHSDIMPVAWAEHLKEEPQENATQANLTCDAQNVELLGRDAVDVAIVEIVGNRNESQVGAERVQYSTVRLIERLKRANFWDVGTNREIMVYDSRVALASPNNISALRRGARFIFLFDKTEIEGISPEFCGVVPLNNENLALVKRGIEQDYEAALPVRDHQQ